MNQAELKGLQVRKSKLLAEIKVSKQETTAAQEKLVALRAKLAAVEKQLLKHKETSKGLVISEHAYVRYFERVLGYNLNEVKDWIVPPDVMAMCKKIGNGKYKTKTHEVIIKDNTVITVNTTLL